MPRLPEGNPALASLKPSVFSTLVARLARHDGPTFPLHVGDTYLAPPAGAWLEEQRLADEPGLHRYEIPRGRGELLRAIAEHLSARFPAAPIESENVLVTIGATGGLASAVRALLVPGQTLLILAPYWPLIRGMSVSHGIRCVEIPFYPDVDSPAAAREAILAHADASVGAIYVNWPNNPSGLVSPPSVVRAVLELAEAHDWWVFSDEVYEDYLYSGELLQPGSISQLRGRLIQARSFSKAYGMAGNRVGHLVGPADAIERISRLTTYVVYGACRGAQRAATRALTGGAAWLADARERYRAIGEETAARLGIEPPMGGTFHFFDVSHDVGPGGVPDLLERCVSNGLLVAPGASFGAAYADYLRVCFTCSPPDVVRAGIEILARCLGR